MPELKNVSVFDNLSPFCLPVGIGIPAKPIDIIDGDTIIFAIEEFNQILTIHVRVNGIDTPEIHPRGVEDEDLRRLQKECAITARNATFEYIMSRTYDDIITREYIQNTLAYSNILLSIIPMISSKSSHSTFDSFGRMIASVRNKSNPSDLSQYLLKRKLARPFGECTAGAGWTKERLNLINIK